MNVAHLIRLQPTPAQIIYFARACGVAGFAYNWALAEWKCQHERYPWMRQVTKNAPQQAIKNLGWGVSRRELHFEVTMLHRR